MGMIYKRGKVWWIKYYKNGKSFRESSKTTKKMVAKKLLDRREGEIAQGKIPGVQFEKISFDELAEDFLRDYRINQKRSLDRAERSVTHLKKHFGGDKVPTITTPRINRYIEKRQEESAANATINRELSALKRMLNLGAQQTPPLVDRVPKIHMLAENNVRTGFFEHDEFLKFRDALPSYLKGFTTFGYKFGWRVEEIANLAWSQIDRRQWGVRLEVGTTKNKGGRLIYLDSELKEIFEQLWAQRKASSRLLSYVFPNRSGDGKIRDFRFAWNKAFKESKVEHKLFHDLRRTAVRNLIRAGVPEKVAMLISGHKTRSVFERYNIIDDKDLKLATEQQENYFENVSGTISGTIVDFGTKKPLGGTQEASM
jgi:integrase